MERMKQLFSPLSLTNYSPLNPPMGDLDSGSLNPCLNAYKQAPKGDKCGPLNPPMGDFFLINRLFASITFILCTFSFLLPALSQFNPQNKSITEKFFPDPNISFPTPAFRKTSGFTQYQEMMDWLQETIKPNADKVSLSFIGESQKGKAIPLLVFNLKNGKPKTKVWMQGGLHGDEPAGTEAMLHLIHQLLNEPQMDPLLQDLEIAIVPMANIDGYEKQKRVSANGIDLNRDQTSLKAQESISLKSAFSAFQPAVAIDFHEFRPFRKDFVKMGKAGITTRYDAMFLYSGNLNVPKVLRDFTQQTYVAEAKAVLDNEQLLHHDYLTPQKSGGKVQFNLGSVHSRSSASNFALANCVSVLMEIRGVGIGRTSFKRRVNITYLVAKSYLQTTQTHAKTLEKVLAEAEKSSHPVVVTSERLKRKGNIKVIDLATEKEVELEVTINDALQSSPTLQRQRPQAYLLLPEEKYAAARLKMLGLKLDSLSSEKELEVEAYQLNAMATQEPAEPSGNDVEEDTDKPIPSAFTRIDKRTFPPGTYVIEVKQPRGNLACEVLEPENQNGFVEMKVIVQKGQELPVFRYTKPEKLKP